MIKKLSLLFPIIGLLESCGNSNLRKGTRAQGRGESKHAEPDGHEAPEHERSTEVGHDHDHSQGGEDTDKQSTETTIHPPDQDSHEDHGFENSVPAFRPYSMDDLDKALEKVLLDLDTKANSKNLNKNSQWKSFKTWKTPFVIWIKAVAKHPNSFRRDSTHIYACHLYENSIDCHPKNQIVEFEPPDSPDSLEVD